MTAEEFYLYDLQTKFNKINPKEYYLSYSGGKDSHLLLWFIKEYLHNDDIEIIGINTYMEHPEIRERIYKYSDRVLLPAMKPFDIKNQFGSPCFSKIQDDFIYRYQKGSRCKSVMDRIEKRSFTGKDGKVHTSSFCLNSKARKLLLTGKLHKISPLCCTYLKKIPAKEFEKQTGKKAILGVRGSEGSLRRSQYTSCFTKNKKFTPLFDLTNELEEAIYKKYNIEIPKVYERIERTGCMRMPISEAIKVIQKKNLHY